VAVIDTGVDLDHSELSGRLVSGWDFVNSDAFPDDDNIWLGGKLIYGHGTHAAGMIAANIDNLSGIAGAAWKNQVKIMPIKVLDSAGNGPIDDLVAGINLAVTNGAHIINLSLEFYSSSNSTLLQTAIDNAVSNGVLVIAAAGNSNRDIDVSPKCYPAVYSNVFTVGATDSTDFVTYYSNYSFTPNLLNVVAPGGALIAYHPSYPEDFGVTSTANTGGWSPVDGTSFAAPQVSALAALIWLQEPTLTDSQVKSRITNNCEFLGEAAAFQGDGRINVHAALGIYKTPTPTSTPLPTLTITPSATRSVTFTPTGSRTGTRTITATSTPTRTATITKTTTPTFTITSTFTNTPVFTRTITPTDSPTATITKTATPTLSATPSGTITVTGTKTGTPTISRTATPTNTPLISRTYTPSPSITVTSTISQTPTVTPIFTPTITPTQTKTYTITQTATISPTLTLSVTFTPTATNSKTMTSTATLTQSATLTISPTARNTSTVTFTPTASITTTVTMTPTLRVAANDLAHVVPFPNPWRADRAQGLERMVFTNLPRNATLAIYTIHGRMVKKINPGTYSDQGRTNHRGSTGRIEWGLSNSNGQSVSSGIYIYVVKDEAGNQVSGKLAIIR